MISSPLTPHLSPSANALTAPTTPDRRLPVVDKTQVDPQTLQAAQGMESMFLNYMLKVMRDTVPKNEMDLESPATGIYRGMQDTEIAQRAAHAGGIGLADQIVAYLESQRYTLPRGQGVPARAETANAVSSNHGARSTGGTHEGQPVHE
jgi:Rod binding domain-containing protein